MEEEEERLEDQAISPRWRASRGGTLRLFRVRAQGPAMTPPPTPPLSLSFTKQ